MSWWGTLDAEFYPATASARSMAGEMRRQFEERDSIAPTGSETGPTVDEYSGEERIGVYGRLRDVSDAVDSPLVLAWFARHAEYCDRATLLWELDAGPRYRYRWEGGTLIRERGVLDA